MLGWSLIGRSLYKTVFYKVSLPRAQQYCTDLSAELVQIDSMEETKSLYTMLETNYEIYPDSEYWVNNTVETTAVSDWGQDKPTAGDCLVLGKDGKDWTWKGADCETEEGKYFICKKPVTTESSKS